MTKLIESYNLVNFGKNPLLAAQKLIALSYHESATSDSEKSLLAAAHYTMSTQKNLSLKQSQMHLNSAIALLQPLKNSTHKWATQIAWAHFRRAEVLEKRECFEAALYDYQQVIETLTASAQQDEAHTLLLVKSYLASTHLYLNHSLDGEKVNDSALKTLFGWVNAAQRHLKTLSDPSSNMISLLVYSYQTAGIVLTRFNYLYEAIQAFRNSLKATFQIEDIETTAPLLVDLYNCLSYLYQGFEHYDFIQMHAPDIEYESIYSTLSLLFKDTSEYNEEEVINLYALVELVGRAIDPYELTLPLPIVTDIVDALTYARPYLLNKTFPNQILIEELEDFMLDNIYVQQLNQLFSEYMQRTDSYFGLLEIANPAHLDLSLDIKNILNNPPSNIYSLEERRNKQPTKQWNQ